MFVLHRLKHIIKILIDCLLRILSDELEILSRHLRYLYGLLQCCLLAHSYFAQVFVLSLLIENFVLWLCVSSGRLNVSHG